MIALFLDTSDNKEIQVRLKTDTTDETCKETVGPKRAQVVLPLINTLLKKHNLKLTELTHVYVNKGPGSFTGLRVGVTIANTLGVVLRIPINDLPVGQMVEAVYS